MNQGSGDNSNLTVDVTRMYVNVREITSDGNVRFDFAIAWPELTVELVLPQSAFEDFCRHNAVKQLPAIAADSLPPAGGDKE